MELLRGYHSSSYGGVIYNITCTILLHLSTHPTKMRQTSVNVDR